MGFLISFWGFSFFLETTRTKYLFYCKYTLRFPHNHVQTQARHQKADVGTISETEGSAINVGQQGPFPVTIIMLMRLVAL